MEFCYECQHDNPAEMVQTYDCDVCGGRKCHMHGGEGNHSCTICGRANLCACCVSFSACCHDYTDGKFVRRP